MVSFTIPVFAAIGAQRVRSHDHQWYTLQKKEQTSGT
jgi:hypothetical protein